MNCLTLATIELSHWVQVEGFGRYSGWVATNTSTGKGTPRKGHVEWQICVRDLSQLVFYSTQVTWPLPPANQEDHTAVCHFGDH